MARKDANPDFISSDPITLPEPFTVSPLYVVLFAGVGSHVKGDVVMAGDLGSDADIKRLLELGALAPWESKEGQAGVADAAQAATEAAPPAPLQTGVPYVDPNVPV